MDEVELPLRALAHSRAGDKGNRVNLSLIALRPILYETLAREVTTGRVLALFQHRQPTRCQRYELPNLYAFNFVIDDVLEGGVNGSLNLDGHGKTLSSRLLGLKVRVARYLVE